MQKISPDIIQSEAPFFDLLADADTIKVREINSEEAENRTFVVQVRLKPAPQEVVKVLEAPAAEENRGYLLKSAELLLVDGDYILARNIYSYLLKIDLRDVESLQGLGVCFLRLGDIPAAKKCFMALADLAPNPRCFLWLGQCLVNEGDDSSAIAQFLKIENVAELPPDHQFELFKELGNCENRRGNFDEAWAMYHKAMAIQPNSDVIYVNLGTLEVQRHHDEVASSYFQKAVELNPKNSKAHCGLGIVALGKNETVAASIAFETALNLDGQNLIALYQLILLADLSKTYTSVTKRLLDFLERDPKNADVRYRLAAVYYKEGDWARSEEEVETVLSQDPSHLKAKALKQDLQANKHLPR